MAGVYRFHGGGGAICWGVGWARGRLPATSATINSPIFMVRVGRGSKVSPCVHVGIQVEGLFAIGPKQLCFESYVDTMGERTHILL